MKRMSSFVGALAVSLGLALCLVPGATAQEQQPQKAKPGYTMPEYNAYQLCVADQNAQTKVKCLDDFAAKYPNSELLPYAYREYYRAYAQLRDYPKMATYADKMLALGDKVDMATRLEAAQVRAQAFYLGQNLPAFQTAEQLRAARTAAKDGLALLEKFQKPEQVPEEQFAAQKKGVSILFYSVEGIAAMMAKDMRGAIDAFESLHKLDPKEATNVYRLGRAYLSLDPPQYIDGFWHLAQAINLKVQGEQQIRAYLRAQLLRYQAPACESLIDPQMNELLTLAGQVGDRPASYSLPSSADLQRIREETATTFINELKAGGDRAKLVFMAYCGLEFPEVGGKVISVEASDGPITVKLFLGATPEDTEAGTVANMDIQVVDQPEAKRLATVKDWALRFSGTLSGYDPEPFMLHWTKCKINPEDIPEEAAPGKAAKRPTKKPPRP
jgi:hypothetical protein